MIGRSTMSIKKKKKNASHERGQHWMGGGGTFSNYGNSVGRSGHLEWSVYRASILGNNILYFRSQRGCSWVSINMCVRVCVCGGGLLSVYHSDPLNEKLLDRYQFETKAVKGYH